jgi:hypothetical protein
MLMVEMLARMPDLRRRIQAEHLADSTGHCRDCPGAPWPCELYRLAIEVDRRYGPCHSTTPWTGPVHRRTPPVQHPAPPPPRYGGHPPGPPGPPPVVQPPSGAPPFPAARAATPARPMTVPPLVPGPAGPLTPPPPRYTPPVPSEPTWVSSQAGSSQAGSSRSAPLPASPAGPGPVGQDAVVLPLPRRTGGHPPRTPGRPGIPAGLAARHDELSARRARREELRARRWRVDPSRDGGRHDLVRPYGNHPAGSRLRNGPEPRGELIDVLEDVLRWSH